MIILKNAGNSTILATWPSPETNKEAQSILERAGRTCYQSLKGPITPESSAHFVERIMKRGHYSVIEHGWRGYIIEDNRPENILQLFWPEVKFMSVTWRNNVVLISGNLESWRKLYTSKKLLDFEGILQDLENFTPTVFNQKQARKYPCYDECSPIDSVDCLENEEEILSHVAHTVQYNNLSRGFTHELVRHRVPVYSQESTRYVDESNFNFVLPPHLNENEQVIPLDRRITNYSVVEILGFLEQTYRALRTKGWKPEDARQILPTAIKSQVIMSCNLLTRRYIYSRRCHRASHWEIRKAMCDELKYMQTMYPNLFRDFIYNEKTKAYDVPDCTAYFWKPNP